MLTCMLSVVPFNVCVGSMHAAAGAEAAGAAVVMVPCMLAVVPIDVTP
jgi:hypothetical protein